KGTPQELGEGFFPASTEPVQATSQLLTNMEQFRKGQEEAKKESAMEKKKTEKADKPALEVSAKETKFLEAMKQEAVLEAEGKDNQQRAITERAGRSQKGIRNGEEENRESRQACTRGKPKGKEIP